MRTDRRHPHRDNVISPGILAIVLAVAFVVALIPFVIVLGELQLGDQRYLPLLLAVVTVFFLLLPLALRFLTPGSRRGRGAG